MAPTIQQVIDRGATASGNAETTATTATAAEPRVEQHTQARSKDAPKTSQARPERPVSQHIVGQEEKKLVHDSKTATKQPKKANANNHAHDGKHPSAEGLQLSHGARQQQQRAEGRVEAGARVSSSSRLRSSLDGRKSTRAEGIGPGGGGDNTHRKSENIVTTALDGRHQQQHQGVQGAGKGLHEPQRVDVARGGREGPSTSASSSSERNRFSFEHPSVWDVGQPVTGLAEVDSASTMNGLLDREVRKR